MLVCVLLAIEHGFAREIMEGILEYTGGRNDLQVIWCHPHDNRRAQYLRDADGLVCTPGLLSIPRHLRRHTVTVTGISGASHRHPAVIEDNVAVGRMAADYFLEKQYRRLVFAGYYAQSFSQMREKGFRERAHEAGVAVDVIKDDLSGKVALGWLRKVTPPFAVFAANDVAALLVAEAASSVGLHIPEDMALLGVDNDTLLCRCANPPLSSIDTNTRGMGFRAAALLEELFTNTSPPENIATIKPRGVVERQSTEAVTVDNLYVRKALLFIRQNATNGIKVMDVAKVAGINRRTLEMLFKQHLQRTIHHEIFSVKMRRAREMLAETKWPIADIVGQCGFGYPSQFAKAFREHTGSSPLEYRKNAQCGKL